MGIRPYKKTSVPVVIRVDPPALAGGRKGRPYVHAGNAARDCWVPGRSRVFAAVIKNINCLIFPNQHFLDIFVDCDENYSFFQRNPLAFCAI